MHLRPALGASMKPERWRRNLRPWLLLRPSTEAESWQWARVEDGRVRASGSGEPPTMARARVALLIPAEVCSHFHLQAPPGLKRHEWPLLLEDRLLQPAEQVSIGCIDRQPGWLELVCVDAQRLQRWSACCQAWGLQPERCWAELQLLPRAEPSQVLGWQREPGLQLYKRASAAGQQFWLAWPETLGEPPEAGGYAGAVVQTDGPWPEQLPPLDNLPGTFDLQTGKRRWLASGLRLDWRLPAACLALTMLWGGIWASQQWRQQAQYQQQVWAVTGAAEPLPQATQHLRRLREEADEQRLRLRQVEQLQARVSQWLSQQDARQLDGVAYDGRSWRLRLNGDDDGAAPWQAFADEVGVVARVEQQPGNQNISFDLEAGP